MAPAEPSLRPDANDLAFKPLPRSASRKRWGLRLFILFLLLAGGGAAGWYGFGEFGAKAPLEIPLVRADPAPIKVRPESPGGIQVPNQDKKVYGLIQGKGESPQPESLLPPPETPLPPPKPAAAPVAQAPKTATEKPPQQVAAKDPPTRTAAKVEAPAPVKVVPPSPPPQASVPTQEEVAAAKLQPSLPPAPEPKAEPRQPLSPTSGATAKASSGAAFTVQLAAVRSPDRAQEEWDRLRKKHADLLGKLSLSIVKADLGAKKGIFYRLRAGPVGGETTARALCAELAKRKVGCLIVHPGR